MALSHDLTVAGVQASPGTTIATGPFTTITGDLLHVTAGYDFTGGAKSITDSQSETWTWSMAEVAQGGGRMRPAWAKVTTGGSGRTVSLNSTTQSDALILGVDMLGGVDTTTPINQIASAAFASTTTPASPSITTTVANCLLVGFLIESNGGTNKITVGTIGGVAASQGSEFDSSGLWFGLSDEYRIVSATGSYSASWNLTAADTGMAGIVAYKAAAGQTVAIGQVTETDLAQAITRRKSKVLGQTTENNTASVLSRVKTRAIGQAAETDLAQPITVNPKRRLIAQVAETELAQPCSARKTRPLGPSSESDLAQSLVSIKRRALGQTIEVDLAQAVARRKTRTVAQAIEMDLAQGMVARKVANLGQAAETDLAQPISFSGTKIIAVNQVSETDLAQSVIWAPKLRRLAQIAETDAAQFISARKFKPLAQTAETDLAQGVLHAKIKALGQSSETDLAQPMTGLKRRALGLSAETDAAQIIMPRKLKILSQTLETDVAQGIARIKVRTISQIVETDLAQTFAPRKLRLIAQVEELDLAQAVASSGGTIPNYIRMAQIVALMPRCIGIVGSMPSTSTIVGTA